MCCFSVPLRWICINTWVSLLTRFSEVPKRFLLIGSCMLVNLPLSKYSMCLCGEEKKKSVVSHLAFLHLLLYARLGPFSLPLHGLQKWMCLGFFFPPSFLNTRGELEGFRVDWRKTRCSRWQHESLDNLQRSGFPLCCEPGKLSLLRISKLLWCNVSSCPLEWVTNISKTVLAVQFL